MKIENEAGAKEAILDMIYDNGGMAGISNDNGADSYMCTSCLRTITIEGYSHGLGGGFHDIEHRDDCQLMALYKWALGE